MSGLMGFDEAFRAADLAVRAIRQDGLRDIERLVLEGSWNRDTYQAIASKAGYTEGYLSRDVGPALWSVLSDALGVPVKKTNFRTAIERWSKQAQGQLAEPAPSGASASAVVAPPSVEQDTALPLDISDFRGRSAAIADLTGWIVEGRGRVLFLSGLPGVGKTWLSIKLFEQVRSQFHQLIYLDLGQYASPADLLTTVLQHLQVSVAPVMSLAAQLDLLVQTLAHRKCFIVLDRAECLHNHQSLAGNYRPELAEYNQVLTVLTHRDHQGCVVWAGRELPRDVSVSMGSSCRLYRLEGLTADEVSTLPIWPETLEALPDDWQQLSQQYGGLPGLILQDVAPRLASFDNQLGLCLAALQQDSRFVGAYLSNWLSPLSAIEWQILTWMMLSRRPLSMEQISQYLGTSMPLEALESLRDRGVCRSVSGKPPTWELALPELLHPFLQSRTLSEFRCATRSQRIAWLDRYPLLQASAPEMVRQWQRRTLLKAVATDLEADYPNLSDRRRFLREGLHQIQAMTSPGKTPGYCAGNLVNLAHYWQIALVHEDFRGLLLRDADLQSDLFQGISFAGADLSETVLAKPMGRCPVIAANPAQAEIVVGDQDGRLLVWSVRDGRLIQAMSDFAEAVRAIAFSPDGLTLAEGRQDGVVRLWDVQSDYAPERFAHCPEGALTTLAISYDQQLLVGGDETGLLHVWRLASGEEIFQIPAHTGGVTAIAFSPCSRRLLSCGPDCMAVEWDLQTGHELHRFQGRLTNLLGTVTYQPDAASASAQAMVIGRDEGQLVMWDVRTGWPEFMMGEPCDAFMAIALSPNGRYLAVSDVNNVVSVWRVASRSQLCQITESCAPIESLLFSVDGSELMTGCDYAVQQWDVTSGQCLRVWQSDRHPPLQLAIASSPLQLFSTHDDHTLRCWQFSPARQHWLPMERFQIPEADSPPRVIATDRAGTCWAIGTESGQIHLWDPQQQTWSTWSMHLPESITALALNTQGTLLAAGDIAGTVALWDLPNRIFRWQKVQTHAAQVMTIAFAADNHQVFSGSRDRTIQSWDLKGNPLSSYAGHLRRVHTACLSQDGKVLYSGSYDGTVKRWQRTSGDCLATWQRDDAFIYQIALDEQGTAIAIVSDTQTIEIWEIETDRCRAKLTFHRDPIWHVSTSPDGRALVCSDQAGEVTLWSTTTGELLGQLRVDRPYEGMQIGGCTGITEVERQMLYSLGATDY